MKTGKEKVLEEIEDGLKSSIEVDGNIHYFDTQILIIFDYSNQVKTRSYYQEIVKNEPYYKRLKDR